MIWKSAHLPKELRNVHAQRSQMSRAKDSKTAPRAMVTMERSMAGRRPALSAITAIITIVIVVVV